MNRNERIAVEMARLTGVRCDMEPCERVSGGNINECYRWLSSVGALFVKVAPRKDLAMLEEEGAGLEALRKARALRVPSVRAVGSTQDAAFLVLEWIERGKADRTSEMKLGKRLAEQHRHVAERFGHDQDNHIGRTPQANGWLHDWAEFFRERRLRPQLELASRNGIRFGSAAEKLLDATTALLDHHPQASLLHGDLWGGNWFADTGGEPVIFDPAVYHGDREADIAMTRLFGGFGSAFYHAYEMAMPLPPGAAIRCELYNLYHILNHSNLFGGAYTRQARDTINRLLAQVRG